mgnify:FL=1
MANILHILRDVVGTVAPVLASALGGPLAGTAVRSLSELLLGTPDGTPDEVTRAIQTADPATLLRIKELETQFQQQMAALGVDLERLANEDRASARQRQIATKDILPGVIALGVLMGFFGLLALIAFRPLPTTAEAPLNVMLGALAGMVTAVAQYYFGSSSSSRAKDSTIAALKNGGA